MKRPQSIHGSCVARDGAGVLLLGPSGCGKSDLTLRLLSRGFVLVADDQVVIEDGFASPAPTLAGLLEVRGLGIVRLQYAAPARLALAAELVRFPWKPPSGSDERGSQRLPQPQTHPQFDLPLITIDAFAASAPDRIGLALDCALGRRAQFAGAFAS